MNRPTNTARRQQNKYTVTGLSVADLIHLLETETNPTGRCLACRERGYRIFIDGRQDVTSRMSFHKNELAPLALSQPGCLRRGRGREGGLARSRPPRLRAGFGLRYSEYQLAVDR